MITSGPILIFDGVCNLCNRLVEFIIRKDTGARIRFASLQSEAGQSILTKIGIPENYFDSVVLILNEKYFLKSSAVLHLLKELGGVWSILFGLIIIPKFIRDLFYTLIARNRYRIFGKKATCILPGPDIEARFLS
jgi:predicted DCC family thiol-disulfide oxidoreductase YuxK